MSMPHARLERLNIDQELEIEDPTASLDYIYVLKGGLKIETELTQISRVLLNQGVDFSDNGEDDFFTNG